jgi:hypothetical protein
VLRANFVRVALEVGAARVDHAHPSPLPSPHGKGPGRNTAP